MVPGWCRSVFETVRQCRTVSTFLEGVEVSNGHFGTSAELSWVRNVQGPKCPYTQEIQLSLNDADQRILFLEFFDADRPPAPPAGGVRQLVLLNAVLITSVRPSTKRRCKCRSHFGIFAHLSKVFSRDAWLAELFNRPLL